MALDDKNESRAAVNPAEAAIIRGCIVRFLAGIGIGICVSLFFMLLGYVVVRIDPLDLGYSLRAFTSLGSIAGFIIGIVWSAAFAWSKHRDLPDS